ncbi:MAG: symmetrical bis(5'-nucleosyl)-tetraphosphatase [Deltaproteobacteria bacterium]|nr:symmetrical bis(5'-nucleosyl)-tetraphosphatase [Deltaproteobacteria bacterium]
MVTYAIGDVQGCFESLEALIEILPGSSAAELCLVGDLVNRGPRSLEVLRLARGDPRFVAVLGNHDLHLLARADGVRPRKTRDTLDEILEAKDRDDLLAWLATRPFLVHREGWDVVHAGLLPTWTSEESRGRAHALESAFADPYVRRSLLEALQSRGESSEELVKTLRVLTMLRTCDADGTASFDFAGPPEAAPSGYQPWYSWPHRRTSPVAFGHWAMLGFRLGADFAALDSGCVWGHRLTALRLEDRAVYSVAAREPRPASFAD